MPRIRIELPSLLHENAGGQSSVSVEAETLSGALRALSESYPRLRDNLFESDGTQRQHVLIFYNEENTRWLDNLDVPLQAGDRLTIVQSVSGG